ncbi:MAG: efflux RND transporter permease subunit, partial [Fibrobacter sp.]|nr:efflux RND transporter permease subunit [Fibrobacter sp.]
MFLTKISVHRPIAVIMLVLLLVISGIISFFKIPVTLMPETELPSVSVAIPFPGAGAEKIETTVFKPIEEQLTSI